MTLEDPRDSAGTFALSEIEWLLAQPLGSLDLAYHPESYPILSQIVSYLWPDWLHSSLEFRLGVVSQTPFRTVDGSAISATRIKDDLFSLEPLQHDLRVERPLDTTDWLELLEEAALVLFQGNVPAMTRIEVALLRRCILIRNETDALLAARSMAAIGHFRRDTGVVMGRDSAVSAYRSAKELFVDVGDQAGTATMDLMLAVCAEMSGKSRQSMEAYRQLATDPRLSQRERALATLWVGTSATKESLGDVGVTWILAAIQYLDSVGTETDLNTAFQKLALAYKADKKFDLALSTIEDMQQLSSFASPIQRVRIEVAHADVLLSVNPGDQTSLRRLAEARDSAHAHGLAHQVSAIDRILRRLQMQPDELPRMAPRAKVAGCDVLIVVSTPIELDAITSTLASLGMIQTRMFGKSNVYWFFCDTKMGTFAVVRSGQGSVGPEGSALVVRDAIDDVQPWAVVAVGIAFGKDEKKQPIGTVLVSSTLSCYESQRVGTSVLPRGPQRVPASAALLGRFRMAASDLNMFVEDGEILSGEKLVDNENFRDGLFAIYPEAIGGEMEASGIHAACHREGVDWLVVKAVCDYAASKSTNKVRRQRTAAVRACSLLRAAIEGGGLKR